MRRRPLATLALAVLVSFPMVGQAVAAEPAPSDGAVLASAPPSPESSPPLTTSPAPDPTPDPTGLPSAPSPTPDPGVAPVQPAASATSESPASAVPRRAVPTPSRSQTASDGRPDPTGRYIVVLNPGADIAKLEARHVAREGLRVTRSFGRAIRGFSAKLNAAQRHALLADPNVVEVVPDELVELAAQTVPTGVSRIGTRTSATAQIDGVDQRVDADVAIIDTGIYQHPDLNVAGGYNCSTSNRALWRDVEGHGTHVAGTVAAIDNSFGVVGVAPGARLWAVKILNDSGYGLLSWYVCGLDWVLSQRDPADPSRPRFEVANMSVAKYGRDDGRCGNSNRDILHKAICRVVAGGITVVAAAGNDHASAAARVPAAYNEVITVSALADTDGRSGGTGGNRCYSWGGYDKDDTFADFSNFGSDVDLIAPGKCIWSTKPGPRYGYSSGTSMAAPAVTGAVALYKATRPRATPAEVRAYLRYLGNRNWKTWTDPDRVHEPLLDVSRIGSLGTFGFATPSSRPPVGEAGGTARVPVVLTRSPTFFERVSLSVSNVPSGWSASFAASSLMGWSGRATDLRVTVPPRTPAGTYTLRVTGSNWGRTATTDLSITVVNDIPSASAPNVTPSLGSGVVMDATGVPTAAAMRVTWSAATDKSSAIAGYEVEHRVNGGSWAGTRAMSARTRSAIFYGLDLAASHGFRLRARDTAGNWSLWQPMAADVTFANVSDRSPSIGYRVSWARYTTTSGTNHSHTSSHARGATARLTFTGRGIAVLAPRGPGRGKIRVFVDGIDRGTVDTYRNAFLPRRMVFVKPFASSGTHTIVVRVEGTSGRPNFSLDGFIVLR